MKKKEDNSKKPLIGIIGGKGKMGNWFKGFFEGQGLEVLVSDINTPLSSAELAKRADIVIVSVPIKETVKVIKEIRGLVRKESLLCDIASLKVNPVKAMKRARSGVLGMHPLFGPLVQNIKDQKIVFCRVNPVRDSSLNGVKDNQWVGFLKTIFVKHRAKIIEMSPEKHDKQMAMVQALIHFANISLARTLYSQKADFKDLFLTPIFRLQSLIIGRILSQNPELYAEIEIENPYFTRVLADFGKQESALAKDIKDKNFKDFVKKFKEISFRLNGFKEVAQTKSSEVLRIIERQPVKVKETRKKIEFKKKDLKIGFLGPEGTFSHQAALNIFSAAAKIIACPTISKIFEMVMNEEITLGVAPAENSTEGLIQETLDNLIKYPLNIIGSYILPIHLCLLARTDNANDIKIIKSHPQPIAQSRNWLSKNFPNVKLETESSSTDAILSTTDPSIAFIASKAAAKKYNLKILAEDIEDKKINATQFYIIGKAEEPALSKKLKNQKGLILLSVYDRVGALRDILNCFAEQKLNLSKLHSKASEAEAWKYYFFLEVESSPDSKELQKALKDIEQYCSIVRLLGRT